MTERSFKPLPKTIVVVDDHAADLAEELLTVIFPGSRILQYEHFYDYIMDMPKQPLPELLVIDSSDHGRFPEFGANSALGILERFASLTPDAPLPDVVFTSADLHLAREASEILRDDLHKIGDPRTKEIMIEQTGYPEMSRIQGVIEHNEFSFRHMGTEVATGLRTLLNAKYGYHYPVTESECIAFLQSFGAEASPDTFIEALGKEQMPQDDALWHLREHARYVYLKQFRVDVLHAKKPGIRLRFGHSSAVVGRAAFTPEAVKRLAQERKKPIYLSAHANCADVVSLFPYVAGVVVFNAEGQGHMGLLAQAHQVPLLLDLDQPTGTRNGQYSVVVTSGTDEDSASFYFEKNNKPPKLLAQIKEGDGITLAPDDATLYAEPLVLAEAEPQYDEDWPRTAKYELLEWHEKNNLKPLTFKATIDSLSCKIEDRPDQIGLVRSESLILQDSKALQHLRLALLEKAPESFEALAERTAKHLVLCYEKILNGASYRDRLVRYRLLDMPPAEFLKGDDLARVGELYGDADIRGIDLAHKLPELYDAQLRGILAADLSDFPNPPEILIPMVRTAEDVLFVRQRLELLAQKMGRDVSGYRVGAMMETLEAAENIQEIAPLCDFISVGSNDFTAAVLDCPRGDWDKRLALTQASGRSHDPFITIHPHVAARITETAQRARKANPNLAIDLCGAHGADLRSLEMLRPAQLDGVSVTPTNKNLFGLPLLYMFNTHQSFTPKPRETATTYHYLPTEAPAP